MLCFFSIPLPWSACTGPSTRLLGECLQAGAALPAETVPTTPLGADHHENHSLGHLQRICLAPALVIPVPRAMGGSAVWVVSAAASTPQVLHQGEYQVPALEQKQQWLPVLGAASTLALALLLALSHLIHLLIFPA